MSGRGSETSGFSLIELLVALVVLGLAAVVMTVGVGRIGMSLNLANRGDDRLDSIAAAQLVLRQRLAAADPIADQSAGSGFLDFGGVDTDVEFVGEPEARAAPDALQRYRIARDPDGDLVLLRVSTLDERFDANGLGAIGWASSPLVHGTARLEVRYYGASIGNPALKLWQNNWTHRETLPMLVALRVTFPAGDGRVWPDLIVHPRAAVPVPCHEEAGTVGCAHVKASA